MTELEPVPGTPTLVVGTVKFAGSPLPVVDPRTDRRQLPTKPDPSQHLIVVSARSRYALWVDVVEGVTSAAYQDIRRRPVNPDGSTIQEIMREGEAIPILSVEALDPSPNLAVSATAAMAAPTCVPASSALRSRNEIERPTTPLTQRFAPRPQLAFA